MVPGSLHRNRPAQDKEAGEHSENTNASEGKGASERSSSDSRPLSPSVGREDQLSQPGEYVLWH